MWRKYYESFNYFAYCACSGSGNRFIRKVNLGFLSIGVAFALGTFGGMSAKEIVGGFSSSMFVTLVGVTFLFGMASNNGTLDLFSKKVVALVGKRTILIPILMFFCRHSFQQSVRGILRQAF